jgi:hypothetical protein
MTAAASEKCYWRIEGTVIFCPQVSCQVMSNSLAEGFSNVYLKLKTRWLLLVETVFKGPDDMGAWFQG